MDGTRIYIRVHKQDHTFDEFRIYEDELDQTFREFLEEREG